MRVLLKDADDRTTFVVEAAVINYNPIHRAMAIVIDKNWMYSVCGPSAEEAKIAITTAFETGKVDLTRYSANFVVD